jgi:hypothetical protein
MKVDGGLMIRTYNKTIRKSDYHIKEPTNFNGQDYSIRQTTRNKYSEHEIIDSIYFCK